MSPVLKSTGGGVTLGQNMEEGVTYVSQILTQSGRDIGLSYAKKIVSIASAVSAQCMYVTDRQTDKEQNSIINHLLHKSSFYSQFPRCNTLFAILPHTQLRTTEN